MKIIRYYQPRAAALTPFASSYGRVPLVAFEREFDRLLNAAVSDLFTLAPNLATATGRVAVDLYEDQNNVYVRAELPGVDRKQIDVELVEDQLTLSIAKQPAPEPAAASASGTAENANSATASDACDSTGDCACYSRTLTIPSLVQADKIAASYENGVLTVTLPKREEAKPRKVTVEVK